MNWPPHITVATVVQKQDRFLFVEERDKDTGLLVFNQPAGHLEPNETIFDAAVRETLEETGHKVALTSIVGMYHYASTNNQTIYHRICFRAEVLELTDHALDSDITAVHWLGYNEIAAKPLRSPLVLTCLNDALNRPPIELEFLQHL
ncbi:MAG: NUDIX hydrolase [Pseudomonadales bacterium]|nr:NUDIX hydrolase [Pseudomonadales bacterium]MDG1443943.1 NUDIX hydrolase [Pseudomonadales bacterium]